MKNCSVSQPHQNRSADDYTVRHAGAIRPRTVSSARAVRPATTAAEEAGTWLIVLLVILALMLIGIVGCVALIGTAGKAVDEAVTEVSASQETSQQAEEDRNAPREVTPGKAFTIGSHKVLDGWKVKADSSLGDAEFQVSGKAK